ncbi:MAG: hypothetical protein M3P33_01225 [bacterium]|nr:hypothetical protein [bacterium]
MSRKFLEIALAAASRLGYDPKELLAILPERSIANIILAGLSQYWGLDDGVVVGLGVVVGVDVALGVGELVGRGVGELVGREATVGVGVIVGTGVGVMLVEPPRIKAKIVKLENNCCKSTISLYGMSFCYECQ